jgi:lipoate-protein ligase A
VGYQTDKQIVKQISAEIDAEILKSTINLTKTHENPYEVLFVDEWLKTSRGKYQVYYPVTANWERTSAFVGYFQTQDAEKRLTKLLTEEINKAIINDRGSKNR